MSYFKSEEIEIVDSQGGKWLFKPFTPEVRNKVLRTMDLSDIEVDGEKVVSDLGIELELAEKAVAACFIKAPKAVVDEFKEKFDKKFRAGDIIKSDVFDEIITALIPKPAKN